MEFKIETSGNKIKVYTPYLWEFAKRARKAGGDWVGGAWVFDARNIEVARKLMRECYGRDDMPCELVSVRVNIPNGMSVGQGPVDFLGRTIASAKGRDSGARIGDNVCFEQGGATSGGSVKNWTTVIKADSVVLLHDIPRAAVESKLGLPGNFSGTLEILEAVPVEISQINKAVLEAERAQLQTRLAEIEVLLAK